MPATDAICDATIDDLKDWEAVFDEDGEMYSVSPLTITQQARVRYHDWGEPGLGATAIHCFTCEGRHLGPPIDAILLDPGYVPILAPTRTSRASVAYQDDGLAWLTNRGQFWQILTGRKMPGLAELPPPLRRAYGEAIRATWQDTRCRKEPVLWTSPQSIP